MKEFLAIVITSTLVTFPIVGGLAAWLGKVWANRLDQKLRDQYQRAHQQLQQAFELNKQERENEFARESFERQAAFDRERASLGARLQLLVTASESQIKEERVIYQALWETVLATRDAMRRSAMDRAIPTKHLSSDLASKHEEGREEAEKCVQDLLD